MFISGFPSGFSHVSMGYCHASLMPRSLRATAKPPSCLHRKTSRVMEENGHAPEIYRNRPVVPCRPQFPIRLDEPGGRGSGAEGCADEDCSQLGAYQI